MLKQDGPNIYSCGGAWAFVYHSQEELDASPVSGFLSTGQQKGSYSSVSVGDGADFTDFPSWNVLCMDDPCAEAATKLGWK